LLGVSILLAVAIAPNAADGTSLTTTTTAKWLGDFASCFARAEERDGRAWAFMPTVHGGTFTNSGAGSVAAPYSLRIRGAGRLNNVRLYAAGNSTQAEALVKATDECR